MTTVVGNHSAGKRLKELRKALELNQSVFAAKTRISQSALSQLENGHSSLSLESLRNICREFHVNANWLVLGKGPVFTDGPDHVKDLASETERKASDSDLTTPGPVKIPLIAGEAHAGYAKNRDNPEYLSRLATYNIPGFQAGNYRMFQIEGDSMAPTLQPDDIVVCEWLEKWDHLHNTLCILITEKKVLAKRLSFKDGERNLIMSKSDNGVYNDETFKRDEICEIWQIISKLTSQLSPSTQVPAQRLAHLENEVRLLKKLIREFIRNNTESNQTETD